MTLINLIVFDLPLSNPVVKFLLILIIILMAPILLNRLKIPNLLGLIIAGAIIGPNGFGLMERDSSIILSGTAGLLYIMFLAGLEIDLGEFKKQRTKSIVFGLYTFLIPMTLGIVGGIYLLHFSIITSVLLASMFASHTLISYPLISKLGVARNKVVNIAVGGTMITDTLALLVLAVIVGMTEGELNTAFWLRLSISILIFGLIVMLVFPIIGRWFLKRYDDNVSQYIFVLVMVFLGAVLAELAGIEAIIGAFLSGLALNRLILRTSALMNRIEFVGTAIFIPFFLIGVGMLIDYRVFFKDFETIKVAGIMIFIATSAKFLAAWLTQKTYNFTKDERRLIFGLSNAQAAATLAAVLIGYNIIIGQDALGEPIRLLSESVLNGTILMILVTCTHATFVAQKGATNIALAENVDSSYEQMEHTENILIPISNVGTTDELIELGIILKSTPKNHNLYALNIVNAEKADSNSQKNAEKLLHQATRIASASDNTVNELLRYDLNIIQGISNVVKEHEITDLILGLHVKKEISDSFLGNLTEGILQKCNITTLIYKPHQPFSTIKRHLVIVPDKAEKEIGFPFWLIKVWNIARNSGDELVFFATATTLAYIKEIQEKYPISLALREYNTWSNFESIALEIQHNDNVIIILSREDKPSYQQGMDKIADYAKQYFKSNSFILIFPQQIGVQDYSNLNLINPSMMETIEKMDVIGRTISDLFRRK